MSRVREMDLWLASKYPGITIKEASLLKEEYPWQSAVKERLGINSYDEIDGMPNFHTGGHSSLYEDQQRIKKQIELIHLREQREKEIDREITELNRRSIRKKSTLIVNVTDHKHDWETTQLF